MRRLVLFLVAALLAGGAQATVCPNTITTRTGKGSSLTWAEMDANLGDVSGMCTVADTWVVGPASATDNAICRYDATSGKLVQDSSLTVSDVASNIVTLSAISTASLYIKAGSPAAAQGRTLILWGGDGGAAGNAGGDSGQSGGVGNGSGAGGQAYVWGGNGGSSGNGGRAFLQGGDAGGGDGNGGNALVHAGAKAGSGTGGSAILENSTSANKLTCNDTACTPAGTWNGVRNNVPLAYGRSPFAVAAGAGAADDCLIAGTNLGTAYKGWGGSATVKMDGFTRVILICRAKNAGGQSGTISCQLQNLTDGTTTVSAATTTSTTCTTLTNTATGVALTGNKSFECQIKSSAGTDDPLFGSCTMVLEP